MVRAMLARDPHPDSAAVAAPDAWGWAAWRADVLETLRLAWPMALTQLGQVAMMTTDLVLLGYLGDRVVAAAALANTVLFGAFTIGLGFVSAVAPLASQAFGARDPRMVRRALRIGLWAVAVLGVPLSLLQMWGEDILLALGQAPEAAAIAGRYLTSLGWSLMPAWAFMVVRNFMGAVNRPEPALWITLAAIPANAGLAWVLMFGGFGLPALDVLGAGLATTLVNLGMCAAALVVCSTQRPFRKYHVLGRFWRPDWPLAGKLAAVGAPITGAFLLEFGAFSAAALFMGLISTVALAAHQIALQVAAIVFMVPFGISLAATVRVGHAVGRRDMPAVRRAGFAACGLGLVFMGVMTVVVALTRHVIPLAFLGGDAASAPETRALAAVLLALATSFFLADGLQTIAAGALRGLNDTRVPLVFAGIAFWPIGMLTGYLLAFDAGVGAPGVWIGLSLGLIVQAILLVGRFQVLTRRGRLPEVLHAT
jgi:MATE family multidrug resistance protein